MAKEFDPYYEWLGISLKDQPPNHYRLLGIELFEVSRNVIDTAANRQMSFLKEYQAGEHSELTQRLLNELSAARLCLLNKEKKAAYDEKLRAELKAKETPRRPPPSGQARESDAIDADTATQGERKAVEFRVPMAPPIIAEPVLPPIIEPRPSASRPQVPKSPPTRHGTPQTPSTRTTVPQPTAGPEVVKQRSLCRVCGTYFITGVASPSQPLALECPACRARAGRTPPEGGGDEIVAAVLVAKPCVGGAKQGVMYCRNCGNEVRPQSPACLRCGVPPHAGNNYCWNCQGQTHPQAVICVRCGVSLRGTPASSSGSRKTVAPKTTPTEPAVACLLSILIVGLGQVILGQTSKGIVIFLGACVLGALTLGGVWIITVPLSAIDAFLIAKKLHAGRSVGKWEFF